MPAFIKTGTDERVWSRAKAKVRETYPELSEDDDNFWAITTSIYKKLRGKSMKKSASSRVQAVLNKLAYVPLTPAAQEEMPPTDPTTNQQGGQPPMADPSATPQGGGMPPMDPNMMSQGGTPQIQTVPGPNGEPIDPETGFIVLDSVAGIEQDPLTGILFNKMTGEFATPEGQPMSPDQAQAMIEEAMAAQQGGGMPPQEAVPAADPADPGMVGEQPPMDPAMAQQGNAPIDPGVEAMAGGQSMIDPQSGLAIDPTTGMFVQPPMGGAGGAMEGDMGELLPGFDAFVEKSEKLADRQDKLNKRMLHDFSGMRTDIQGVRREIQQLNDNQDTLLARLENVLSVIESMMNVRRGA